jgi:hypothetical protein
MPVNILAETGVGMPSFSAMTLANIGLWVIGFVIGIGILSGIAYFIIRYKKFNKIIILFSKVNGAVVRIGQDRGMFQRVGLAGDYWCKTLRLKKYIPRPVISMGKNTFWYYIREDGEWINFGVEDIDSKMKLAGAYYVDEDMRMQRLAIEKNLRDRYQEKPGFFTKYGGMIMSIFFVLIVVICLILLFKELGGLAEQLGGVASQIEKSSASVHKLAEAVHNLMSKSGGGAVPI